MSETATSKRRFYIGTALNGEIVDVGTYAEADGWTLKTTGGGSWVFTRSTAATPATDPEQGSPTKATPQTTEQVTFHPSGGFILTRIVTYPYQCDACEKSIDLPGLCPTCQQVEIEASGVQCAQCDHDRDDHQNEVDHCMLGWGPGPGDGSEVEGCGCPEFIPTDEALAEADADART